MRPLRVAMRARKPWVRLRLRLLGWNVRFIVLLPWKPGKGGGNKRGRSLVNRACPGKPVGATLSREFSSSAKAPARNRGGADERSRAYPLPGQMRIRAVGNAVNSLNRKGAGYPQSVKHR
jgi:hypothetical protein